MGIDRGEPELDGGDRLLQRGCAVDSAAAPVTSIPSGSAAVSGRRARRGRPARVSSTSRYSASLSCPTESARPKLTFGRGEKPSVNARGSCLDAEGAVEGTGDVAVRDEPDLAVLGEAQANREPGRPPHGPTLRSATEAVPSVTGTALPFGHGGGVVNSMPWPVPWLPPAGGSGEATTCSSA